MNAGDEYPGDRSIESVEHAFMTAYVETQYHYVQFLTEHLADCAAAFEGDLDAVLIVAVLGQRRLEYLRDNLGQGSPDPSRISMSASRISDITNIPRESVRRKLAEMSKKGWVEKDTQARWYIAGRTSETPVRLALSDLESRSFSRLAHLYQRLSAILDRATEYESPR
jgi:hypothetical protein